MSMAAVQARLQQEKVKKFEDFVDGRLKPDLVNAIAQRDKLFQQQKTFLDLKQNIQNLEKNGITSMRSMVNIGSEVYMQAEVPDTRHIFVDVGLGFHVEFTWQEALQFISVREARLASQIDEYTHLIAGIKAQIKMVCEGIRELLQRHQTLGRDMLGRGTPVACLPFCKILGTGMLQGTCQECHSQC